MRYFRTYPWGMQLMLFALMTFTFISAAAAIILGVFTKFTGYSVTQMATITPSSPAGLIHAVMVVQGFQSVAMFLTPAFLFAYLAHPKPVQYLGLRKPGNPAQWLWSLLTMAGAMPVLMFIQELISKINFGADVKAAQAQNEQLMQAFTQTSTPGALLFTLFIMAIIPGLGEELFFRGVLMRFVRKKSRTMWVPIVFSAAVFALSHANYYGLLSIFIAGALLASVYYLTGSLWCSIAAHAFFNGSQVIYSYMANRSAALAQADSIPLWLVAAGAAVLAGAGYMLYKQRTPLPAWWANDYTPAELESL